MVYKYQDEKPKRLDKLSPSDHEDLLRDLVNAFSSLKTPTEAALFVQDLLTEREVTNLSKRLRIAKLFLEGKKYEEIEKELHTSHGTVAKIGAWLAEKGEGFRLIIQRLPKKQKVKDWREYSQWDKLKRRYPSHFWPEMLLEEIVRSANKKEKERLSNVLKNLGQKSSMHKKLQEILNEEYREKHSAKKKAKIRTQGLKS
jgi:TrpR-related protein YerC/YecD